MGARQAAKVGRQLVIPGLSIRAPLIYSPTLTSMCRDPLNKLIKLISCDLGPSNWQLSQTTGNWQPATGVIMKIASTFSSYRLMLTHYAKGKKSEREMGLITLPEIKHDYYLNFSICPREHKSQKPKNQRCNTGKKRNAFLMDFFDELRGGVRWGRQSVLALCGIIVVCFHRMLWHQANKQPSGRQRQREGVAAEPSGAGERRGSEEGPHFYIKTCGLGVLQLQLQICTRNH